MPIRSGLLARLHAFNWTLREFFLGGSTLLVGYLVLIPLVFLVYGTFFTPTAGGLPGSGSFTLENYTEVYSNPRTYQLIWNSLYYAFGNAVLAVSTALVIAWLVERTNVPGRHLFYALAVGPLIIPGILFTISWILLLSPNAGIINVLLQNWLGLSSPPFNLFSMFGMMWTEGLHNAPLAFLLIAAALNSMDPALEDAAKMSGANSLVATYQVTLKLVRPALFASFLLMFLRGFESFEVPSLVGLPARINVLTSRIYLALHSYPSNFGLAGALSVLMLVFAGAGVYWYTRIISHRDKYSTITGKGFRPSTIDLGPWRWPAAVLLAGYLSLVFFLPLIVLLWTSFSPYFTGFSVKMLSELSWDNYRFLFGFPLIQRALRNSTILSLSAATIAMLLAAVVSWVVVKTRIRGRWVLDTLSSMPLAFPSMVFGVSLIWLYLMLPIPLYGTLWILLVAYVTKFLPYGMRYASVSMVQIHNELEEAAEVCGARWVTIFRRILIPLLSPGLLAGWVYILVATFRELGTSILLYTHGTEVISILIFDMWENGKTVEVAAMGVIMILGFLVLTYLSQVLGRRHGIGLGG